MKLPSRYARDALCMGLASLVEPGTVLCFLNVHLDSLESFSWRSPQIEVLAGVLREPGCSGGIIVGDFIAISPEAHVLLDKHELVDAWVALHGRTGSGGATWGVGMELWDGLKPGRLDKFATLSLKAENMQVPQPGLIKIPRSSEPLLYSPWSDHCGLWCSVVIDKVSRFGLAWSTTP